MLQNITVAALSVIISTLICPTGGWQLGISFGTAGALLSNFSQYDPYTTGLSVKAEIYNHKDGPYMGTIYSKFNNKWYSRPNYKGTITNTITYRVNEYF